MLVLTRKKGEEIIIDNEITVSIIKVEGHRVRIGIDAPPEVSVHRSEVSRRIQHDLQVSVAESELSHT